jgi:hypothetical protein
MTGGRKREVEFALRAAVREARRAERAVLLWADCLREELEERSASGRTGEVPWDEAYRTALWQCAVVREFRRQAERVLAPWVAE